MVSAVPVWRADSNTHTYRHKHIYTHTHTQAHTHIHSLGNPDIMTTGKANHSQMIKTDCLKQMRGWRSHKMRYVIFSTSFMGLTSPNQFPKCPIPSTL